MLWICVNTLTRATSPCRKLSRVPGARESVIRTCIGILDIRAAPLADSRRAAAEWNGTVGTRYCLLPDERPPAKALHWPTTGVARWALPVIRAGCPSCRPPRLYSLQVVDSRRQR